MVSVLFICDACQNLIWESNSLRSARRNDELKGADADQRRRLERGSRNFLQMIFHSGLQTCAKNCRLELPNLTIDKNGCFTNNVIIFGGFC